MFILFFLFSFGFVFIVASFDPVFLLSVVRSHSNACLICYFVVCLSWWFVCICFLCVSMQAPSASLLSVGTGNKILFGNSVKMALSFYSHTKYVHKAEEEEDKRLVIDRRSFSNLHKEDFCFFGLGCKLALLEPHIMSAFVNEEVLCSEAFYQARKFEDVRDARFVATRKTSKEQAFAGRGQLPLLPQEKHELEEQGLGVTWFDLDSPQERYE